MKTLKKLSVLICGVVFASLFLASCDGGHATTMHKHAFKGTAKQF
jgi:hypothetical protein